eukprot:IDg14439t1
MKGSQKVARETKIRVTAWARSVSVGTCTFLLSDLLWSRFECAPLKRGGGASVIVRADTCVGPSPAFAYMVYARLCRIANACDCAAAPRSFVLRTHFQRTRVGFNALLAGDANRTLRVRICRQANKNSISLGVAQFCLRTLISSAKTDVLLPRMRSADDPLDAGIRVDKL